MTERTLTAMYDTRGAAETARDGLIALGVPSANVTIHGTESGGTTTTAMETEDKGFWASLGDLFAPEEDRYAYSEGIRRGGHLLTARVPEGMEDAALDVLERSEPIDMDERTASWRQSGWTGYEAGTAGTTAGSAYATSGMAEAGTAGYAAGRQAPLSSEGHLAGRTGDSDVLQVAEEQLRVGKREIGRGSVRVRSYVVERPVEEQVTLRDETVRVERRPVDRPIEAGDAVFKERTIEATEHDEEAVVSKEARVVEEVGLRKDVDTRTETVRDTVRKQEVEVDDDRADRLTDTGTRPLNR